MDNIYKDWLGAFAAIGTPAISRDTAARTGTTKQASTMKVRYCKFIGCPRLIWAETTKGAPDFAQCNQHMPDNPVYFEDCVAVSKERCKELRRALKMKREVQG